MAPLAASVITGNTFKNMSIETSQFKEAKTLEENSYSLVPIRRHVPINSQPEGIEKVTIQLNTNLQRYMQNRC